jgi:hypothetical protein
VAARYGVGAQSITRQLAVDFALLALKSFSCTGSRSARVTLSLCAQMTSTMGSTLLSKLQFLCSIGSRTIPPSRPRSLRPSRAARVHGGRKAGAKQLALDEGERGGTLVVSWSERTIVTMFCFLPAVWRRNIYRTNAIHTARTSASPVIFVDKLSSLFETPGQ